MVERTSSILGPDGRAIVVKTLSEEIATPTIAGVRRTHEDRVASGLTPERLGTILRDAAEGNARAYLTLAEEMEERYLHYASQLQTRRLAIESRDIIVEAPKGANPKVVDAVTELVNDPEFGEALYSATDGISKGYAVVEMMWEYERKALRPVRYIYRDPRFFQMDKLSLTELRLAVDGSIDGIELPQAKFIRHLPRTKAGIPLRRGIARPAAWAYLIQQFTLQDWAAFCEIYGVPFRVGKYNSSASPEDKRTLLRAVASIANDAAAIIPNGMDIEFIEVNGTRGEAVFGSLLDYADKGVSKVVVGQTMTSDDGSSLGQAKIHNEVRLDLNQADCKQLAMTANRDVIRPYVNLNFGPQDVYPHVQIPVPDPEDIEAMAKSAATFMPFGLRIKKSEVLEKLGFSDPGDDDDADVLMAQPTAATIAANPGTGKPKPPAKKPDPGNDDVAAEERKAKTEALAAITFDHKRACRCGACTAFLAAEAGEPDALDQLDALFASAMEDWEAMAAPIVAPIAEIIANASSFEEALSLIQTAGPDASKMAERLARLTAIARGIGDIAD